jgi:hypothetical protein
VRRALEKVRAFDAFPRAVEQPHADAVEPEFLRRRLDDPGECRHYGLAEKFVGRRQREKDLLPADEARFGRG